MKFLSMILILVISVGCGLKIPDLSKKNNPKPIDPQDITRMNNVQIYTNMFENEFNYYQNNPISLYGWDLGGVNSSLRFQTSSIIYRFADLQSEGFASGVVAVCWYRGDGTRDIEYDREWYDALTSLRRKAVVYHENGHCQLSRSHRCGAVNSDRMIGLMYPIIPQETYLGGVIEGIEDEHYKYVFNYLTLEFFAKSSQNINDCGTIESEHDDIDHAHPLFIEE